MLIAISLIVFSSRKDYFYPAQETYKHHTRREMKGVMHQKFDFVFLGHVTFVVSCPTIFDAHF